MNEKKTDSEGYTLDEDGKRATLCGLPIKIVRNLPNPMGPIVLGMFPTEEELKAMKDKWNELDKGDE